MHVLLLSFCATTEMQFIYTDGRMATVYSWDCLWIHCLYVCVCQSNDDDENYPIQCYSLAVALEFLLHIRCKTVFVVQRNVHNISYSASKNMYARTNKTSTEHTTTTQNETNTHIVYRIAMQTKSTAPRFVFLRA